MSDNNEPLTEEAASATPLTPNRSGAILATGIAGALLAWNHYNVTQNGEVSLWIIFIMPLIFCLGVGGLADPRVSLAMGPLGQHFPKRIRVYAGLLAAAGMILSAYLALGVYRLQEPATSSPSENRDGSGASH